MMVHGLVLPEENTTRSGPCGGDGADPRSVVLGEGGGVSAGGRVARARRSGVEESEEKLRGPDFLERDIPGPMQPAHAGQRSQAHAPITMRVRSTPTMRTPLCLRVSR